VQRIGEAIHHLMHLRLQREEHKPSHIEHIPMV
jgi:hypothetical protein